MRLSRALALAAFAGRGVSVCSPDQAGAGPAPEATATVRVENENIVDMRISTEVTFEITPLGGGDARFTAPSRSVQGTKSS
jgi:hypothetical protein